MARSDFGGTVSDYVFSTYSFGGRQLLDLAPAALTFWSAKTGGTQYTDLLLNGSAASSVPVGEDGQIPLFQGPDGVTVLWASAGGPRVRMVTTDGAALQQAKTDAQSANNAAQSAKAAAETAAATATAPTDTTMAAKVNDPASQTRAALSATFERVFTPEEQGAAAAYAAGTDDTAFVQAAINAATAAGGMVLLKRQYQVTGVTANGTVTIVGNGGRFVNGSGRTGLIVTSATQTALTIAADGCTLTDFSVINTNGTDPTSGAGIQITSGDFTHITRVTVHNFFDCVAVDNGYYGTITDSHFLDPVRYSLRVRNSTAGEGDFGDWAYMGNVFGGYSKNRIPTAGVRWESGGGFRFLGNKINGAITPGGVHKSVGIGLDIAVVDGVVTSVFEIVGNSIEGWDNAGILIGHASGGSNTGSVKKITITGNEVAGNSTGPAVAIQPAATGAQFGATIVEGNTLGNYSGGITVRNIKGVTIGHNVHDAVSGIVVSDLGGVLDFYMAPQTVSGDNITLYSVSGMDTTSVGPFQQAGLDYHREIGTVSSTTTDTVLWRVTVPQFGAGRLKFTVAGQVSGVGSYVYTCEAVFSRESGAVTVTQIGTPTTAGTGGGNPVITFDTATVSGEFRIGIKKGATGTSVKGRARLTVDGTVGAVKKGV